MGDGGPVEDTQNGCLVVFMKCIAYMEWSRQVKLIKDIASNKALYNLP